MFLKTLIKGFFSPVQSLSRVWLFATPWTGACQASQSFTISWSLLKLMFIESLMPSSHLIFCCPLLLLSSIFSSIRVFFNKLALWIRWPKHWSFSISSSNEYSGLISFRIDWFGLLAVQGTLKSLLPYHIQNNCIAIVNNFVHSSLLLYEFIKAFLKAEGMRITVCLHLCYQKVLPTFSSNTKLWWINGTQCIFNLYSVSEVEHLFKELFLSFFFFSVHQISFS